MKSFAGKRTILTMICLSLVACDSNLNYAPVTEITAIETIPSTGVHQAPRSETLYEVAWRYGLDYRDLATRNRVLPPYHIQSGQIVYLRGKNIDPTRVKSIEKNLAFNKEPHFVVHAWVWPAKGKIITAFSPLHKGINIAGYAGEPVLAAAPGKVVYSGTGLRGYGNLIILKHNNLYLSAYAHNQVVFVKEGDWVQQGQKIAEMGQTGADKVMLHFEIRRSGLPINPLSLLNA